MAQAIEQVKLTSHTYHILEQMAQARSLTPSELVEDMVRQFQAQGFRWIDPCEPWGEHSLHWRIAPDGAIQWLTSGGEYTIRKLMLDRREDLKAHWQRLYRLAALRDRLTEALAYERMSASLALDIHQQIAEINEYLEPPVFSRPRRER